MLSSLRILAATALLVTASTQAVAPAAAAPIGHPLAIAQPAAGMTEQVYWRRGWGWGGGAFVGGLAAGALIGGASRHVEDLQMLLAEAGTALDQAEAAEHGGEEIVEVVRDAAGELADRVHLLGMDQLAFERPALGAAPPNRSWILVSLRPGPGATNRTAPASPTTKPVWNVACPPETKPSFLSSTSARAVLATSSAHPMIIDRNTRRS